MDEEIQNEPIALEGLAAVFRDQLMACLSECARGRNGLFSAYDHLGEEAPEWPEAARLRELAMAMQGIFAQQQEQNPLSDEFLDLCTICGENHPGEPRMARAFLQRIERGEVGKQEEGERRPW
jgi:hypothetical protein